MRGTEWVVPVVVLIVYLISTIMKSREKDEPVRPNRAGGGGANTGRKPTGDIDRFLQEIDRLRRKSAAEQAPVVKAVPRVRPVVSPPAAQRVRPAARARPAVPVVEDVVVEAMPVAPQMPNLLRPAPEYVTPASPARIAQVSAVELRQSPGVSAAMEMLRSARTMAGAVVLQEVLGPPKCRR